MDFNSTTDYSIGKIVEFHLRALPVLRGCCPSWLLSLFGPSWRTIRITRLGVTLPGLQTIVNAPIKLPRRTRRARRDSEYKSFDAFFELGNVEVDQQPDPYFRQFHIGQQLG